MAGGPDLRLAELGCGGTPAIFLAERCTKFIAVDFSSTGLPEAAAVLRGTNVAFETVEADITDLPFEDDAIDVVYSAHAIYHIDTVDGQVSAQVGARTGARRGRKLHGRKHAFTSGPVDRAEPDSKFVTKQNQ